MSQDSKLEKQVFETVDVVALYLGKVFDRKRMPKIKAVVSFLTGNSENFSYGDKAKHNTVRQLLFKQYQWLGSLHYNRKEYESWMKNIISNHGKTLEISK